MRTDYSASNYTDFMKFLPILKSAKTIWLSTHKNADGDGLGSEIALYHALKKNNHQVKIIHNDRIPARYQFLLEGIECFDAPKIDHSLISKDDLAIIFDTHDPKLCSPLFEILLASQAQIVFIDHHVVFSRKIENVLYNINEQSSCTGEVVLEIIRELGIPLDAKIATALYTSLLFDTQSFKLQRDSMKVFEMAKELIQAGAVHSDIYNRLFDNWSVNKMNYLSKLIANVDYRNPQFAIICITKADLQEFALSTDDVSDLVDLFMAIKSLDGSIVVREEAHNYFKLSFRSRSFEILSWAREFGGGGHLFSAGAWVHDSSENILTKIHAQIEARIDAKVSS